MTQTAKSLAQTKKECESLIFKSSLASAGIAIIPVPFLDVVIDAGILTQLLPEISHRFGLGEARSTIYDAKNKEIQWSAIKELGFEFAGLVATRGVARKAMQNVGTRIITKQVTKFIPLGGQIIAASIGYFALRKIANAHLEECYAQASGQLKLQK